MANVEDKADISNKKAQNVEASSMASITLSEDREALFCNGAWTTMGAANLEDKLQAIIDQSSQVVTIDMSAITRMDSAGALFLQNIIERIQSLGQSVDLIGLSSHYQSLLKMVAKEISKMTLATPEFKHHNMFYQIGLWTVEKWSQLISFLAFTGEVVVAIINSTMRPTRSQWRSTMVAIDETGCRALPIVALMSFLIGIVLAYQLGGQLKIYGANIFIADVTGIAIFREFAPLITAIIIAGRTSTSFAALIGTMKVNEELDAMQTRPNI